MAQKTARVTVTRSVTPMASVPDTGLPQWRHRADIWVLRLRSLVLLHSHVMRAPVTAVVGPEAAPPVGDPATARRRRRLVLGVAAFMAACVAAYLTSNLQDVRALRGVDKLDTIGVAAPVSTQQRARAEEFVRCYADEPVANPYPERDGASACDPCSASMGVPAAQCRFFPVLRYDESTHACVVGDDPDGGLTWPSTHVGRALYCLGKAASADSVLELGTEKGAGARMIALGLRDAGGTGQAASGAVVTVEARRRVYADTKGRWGKDFPEVDWRLGGTVESDGTQQCFQEHYGIAASDAAAEPMLASLLQERDFQAAFADTTACTGAEELAMLMQHSPLRALVLHDMNAKYRAEHVMRYAGWEVVDQVKDHFANNAAAIVGVFINPARF